MAYLSRGVDDEHLAAFRLAVFHGVLGAHGLEGHPRLQFRRQRPPVKQNKTKTKTKNEKRKSRCHAAAASAQARGGICGQELKDKVCI